MQEMHHMQHDVSSVTEAASKEQQEVAAELTRLCNLVLKFKQSFDQVGAQWPLGFRVF